LTLAVGSIITVITTGLNRHNAYRVSGSHRSFRLVPRPTTAQSAAARTSFVRIFSLS
jgi:hypothetical protein